MFPSPHDNQVVSTHGNNMTGKNSAVVRPMPVYPSSTTQPDSSFQPRRNKKRDLPFPYQRNVQSTVTYVSPSRWSVRPLMTPFVTPTVVKQVSVIKRTSPRSDVKTDKSADEDELLDVVNNSSASLDASKSHISMSRQSFVSDSSPSSDSDESLSPVSRPATLEHNESTKKKARTNYSPEQVDALKKVFHENPYPNPEMMENLSKDLNIPEGKIKVWFQNKRARWRKRVQGNTMGYQAPFLSSVPSFMPPLSRMGFLPGNHMMGGASSPVPGHFMPYRQPPPSTVSPNNANKPSRSPISSPFQQRPQLPPYFYSYPYGMYPPYFC